MVEMLAASLAVVVVVAAVLALGLMVVETSGRYLSAHLGFAEQWTSLARSYCRLGDDEAAVRCAMEAWRCARTADRVARWQWWILPASARRDYLEALPAAAMVSEGHVKRGGSNQPPSTRKPAFLPPGQGARQ